MARPFAKSFERQSTVAKHVPRKGIATVMYKGVEMPAWQAKQLRDQERNQSWPTEAP